MQNQYCYDASLSRAGIRPGIDGTGSGIHVHRNQYIEDQAQSPDSITRNRAATQQPPYLDESLQGIDMIVYT